VKKKDNIGNEGKSFGKEALRKV